MVCAVCNFQHTVQRQCPDLPFYRYYVCRKSYEKQTGHRIFSVLVVLEKRETQRSVKL